MPDSCHRKRTRKGRCRWHKLSVTKPRRSESDSPSEWINTNQWQSWYGTRIGSVDSYIRIFYRLEWKRLITNEVVSDADVVDQMRTKTVDLLNRSDSGILLSIDAEAWNVSSSPNLPNTTAAWKKKLPPNRNPF